MTKLNSCIILLLRRIFKQYKISNKMNERRRGMKRGGENERGVSPVVATVLLIAVVIVIALIVFLWLRGVTKEQIVKFGENVELVCDKVDFDADYFAIDGAISVSNLGNYHISNFQIQLIGGGDKETFKTNIEGGVAPGQAKDILPSDYGKSIGSSTDTILVIPVLLGDSNSGNVEYICDERQGKEISLE